jgi:hypothetical protein
VRGFLLTDWVNHLVLASSFHLGTLGVEADLDPERAFVFHMASEMIYSVALEPRTPK